MPSLRSPRSPKMANTRAGVLSVSHVVLSARSIWRYSTQCRVPGCDAVEVRSATGRTGFLVRCDRSTPRFNRSRLALVHQLGGGLRRNDKRIRLRELEQLQITGLSCLVSYRFE